MGRVWLSMAAGAVALLCLIYTVARHVWSVEARLDTATARIDLLQQAQGLADAAEAEALAARKVQDEKNQWRVTETENVLRNNDDWGRAVLPDDVIRLLRHGATDGGAGAVPAPGDASR